MDFLCSLLNALAVPVLRRTLQSILVLDYSFTPVQVTNALSGLLENGRVHQITFTEHGNHLYFYTKFRRSELKRYRTFLESLYAERQAVLNKERLMIAGQRFVREMLVQSGRFKDITDTDNLGNVKIGDLYALDLKATEIATNTPYGISVKNLFAWIYSYGDTAVPIDEIVSMAEGHSVKPWLVASFLSDEAKRACKYKRIRCDSLNAQVVPAEYNPAVKDSQKGNKRMSTQIARLRAVTGIQDYILIPQRFRFHHFEQYRRRFDWAISQRLN